MRKLKIIEHISLDGVMQVSGEGGDFPYGDWTAPYRTPAGREVIMAAHGESFDLLLGRRTYDMWSGSWPKAPSSPIADRLNAAPGTLIRAREYESHAVRHHLHYLQGRRVFEELALWCRD